MTKSLTDRLHYGASRTVVTLEVEETIDELDRILALPRRPPFDCELDPVTKRYQPETQALIEIMTERFSRGKRVSCACRGRIITKQSSDALIIGRVLPAMHVPEPPIIVPFDVFAADNQNNAADQENLVKVANLKVGERIELPPVDGGAGHPCIETLNAVQAWFLREAGQVGGAVGFCGVGSGKSIAFLLAPFLFPDSRLAVLMIEPKQRQHYRSQYLRLREHFQVGSIVFDDGNGYTVPGTTPLHTLSYSVLSQTKNSDLLDVREPDVLMLDEGHRACGNSAINRRIKRYCAGQIIKRENKIAAGEPVRARAVRLLVGSGTMESKSVLDTQMVCAFSLGRNSPVPIDKGEAERWSLVMDANKQPDRASDTAKRLQKAFAGYVFDTDQINIGVGPEADIRKGFCERRLWTPGIISASASTINAAIYFSERKAPKIPQAVADALMQFRTQSLRPDGKILTEKIEQIDCVRNIACGFYTYWAFPDHKCSCTEIVRCASCRLIDDWYEKRKRYYRALRAQLLKGEVNLDSEKLCEEAARRFYQDPPYKGSLPVWECPEWPAWAEIENQIRYEERFKWIENGGDYLVKDAAEWAMSNKGVVWFQSTPFGRKLQELTGLPYFNGGPGAEERMKKEKGDRSIIVSIKAHGAGTDGLQYIFNKQLIAETPASNSTQEGYEQLLGRLHRQGQPKDEVYTEGYFHVRELKEALRKAIVNAEFNFEMTRNKQKLLMADIDIQGI